MADAVAAETPPMARDKAQDGSGAHANNTTSNEHHHSLDETVLTSHVTSYEKHGESNGRRGTGASSTRVSSDDDTLTKSSKLPDWITEHLTWRDLKILIRCSLAAWASFLFVVIHPVLKNYGQAAFMGMLCLFINPPSVVLPFYILAATTILLGICLAWGWGSLAFVAALSQRDDALYNATYGAIRQAAVQTPNPTFYVQRQIFNGELLQTGPTVIMFTMCAIFIYFMARLQASFPKLTLVSIFGMIVIDPYLTTAPLLNNFNGTLPLTFIKPLASAVAIGIVLSLLVFPESCSYATMIILSRSLKRIRRVFEITKYSLGDMDREIPVDEIKKLKLQIVDEHNQMNQGFLFMALEFSVGRWSGQDVGSLKALFQDLFIRGTVLLNFHLFRHEYRQKVLQKAPKDQHALDMDNQSLENPEKAEESEIESVRRHSKHGKHHHPPRRVGFSQTLATMTVYEFLRPDPEVAKLGQSALKAVEDASCNFIAACNAAIETSSEIIHSVNTSRWWGRPKKAEIDALVEKHMEVLDRLKYEREHFALHAVDKMIDPVSHLFDEDGKLIDFSDEKKGVKLPGLMIGINYRHRILAVAQSLIVLLEHLVDLEMKKTETKLWLPFALRGLFSLAFSPEPVNDENALERIETRREREEQNSRKQRHEKRKQKKEQTRAAMRPEVSVSRQRNQFARALTGLFHWLTNGEGVFAARVVIVTIAMAIPTAVKPSAVFCYDNRAVWALIMAQLTISQYMGEFIFSITMRTFGTVIGGVMGLIVWYVGAGSGPGNPYGIMAILAPFVIFIVAIRIFAPMVWLMPTIMGGATMMLVVGYSWEVNYLPSLIYAEPGYGVFYRRLLLVIIGFAAAIIVQVFPRPPSATRSASKSLATSLSDITSFYSEVMSHFLTQEEGAPGEPLEKVQERISKLYTDMQELVPRIMMVKLEPSSSPFTSENLLKVEDHLGKILESLALIAFVSPRLTPMYQKRLEVQTEFTKTNTIASIMAVLGVLEGSLRTGHPLAEVLPVPLLGRLRKVPGPSDGVDSLSKDMLNNEEWSVFVVTLMAVTGLYSRIDDLVMTIKDAVGEKYYIEGLPHHHGHH
ncbi:hypothetical protein Dda_9363 [Drechslerella dactyloides]|uniref:ER transporter 6TM N-terminal domain-containing protein n=1 Tax=Drechslerella dactyloides TaxID=74499 RepID=A0AAD6IQE2_DREDA|nr:hypothetical protein Dda_9363 [Drechslerella dactyloides]